jgi:DNA-binding CsgD family transcriptional regulator
MRGWATGLNPVHPTKIKGEVMIARLTSAEHELVQAVLDGWTTDAELSDRLGVSVNDVLTSIRVIYKKLGITNRAQLALIAIERGMKGTARHTDMRARSMKVRGL